MKVIVKKKSLVQKINEIYIDSEYLFLIDYKGVDSETIYQLRASLRKFDTKLFVLKNTLNKIALNNTNFSVLSNKLKGQIAFVVTKDPVNIAKVLNGFCNSEKKVKFIACATNNVEYDHKYVKVIASLPSIDILRSKLLATLNSSGSNLLCLLNEPANSLVRIFDVYSKKN